MKCRQSSRFEWKNLSVREDVQPRFRLSYVIINFIGMNMQNRALDRLIQEYGNQGPLIFSSTKSVSPSVSWSTRTQWWIAAGAFPFWQRFYVGVGQKKSKIIQKCIRASELVMQESYSQLLNFQSDQVQKQHTNFITEGHWVYPSCVFKA